MFLRFCKQKIRIFTEKTKSTHFCGEFQNGFFRIKEKSCVDIAASYGKTGVFTFLQTKNTHFCGENKKYAFSWRIFQIKMDISVWKIVYHMTGKERVKNGAGMDKRDIS